MAWINAVVARLAMRHPNAESHWLDREGDYLPLWVPKPGIAEVATVPLIRVPRGRLEVGTHG
jgi:hypothetical protein